MHTILKTIAAILGTLRAMPHLLCFSLSSLIMGRDRAFAASGEAVAKIPGQIGLYTRAAFYRATIDHVGKDVYLGFMSIVTHRNARLGDRAYIGRFCSIGSAAIDDGVKLADGVQILSGRHQHTDRGTLRLMPVTIGGNAWIGTNAVIMNDVGEHATVGAGAVVVHPVAGETAVGGVPAIPLRNTKQRAA